MREQDGRIAGKRSSHRRLPGVGRSLALVAMLLAAMVVGAAMRGGSGPLGAVAQEIATPIGSPAPDVAATDPCPDELHGPGSEAWLQTELYFSQPRGDRDAGNDDLFMQFLADEVTPRFPAGLTLLSGVGQWQGRDGDIGQTRSHVLIILYPADGAAESSALLEEIRDEFETQFDQESVLRADTMPVCTSF